MMKVLTNSNRYKLLLVVLLAISFSCEPSPNDSEKQEPSLLMISSSDMKPFKNILIDGISYQLVLQDKDTIYLGTKDPQFKTAEGLTIGDSFLVLPKALQEKMINEKGWAHYLALPSGWNAAFDTGKSQTDSLQNATNTIQWFFKR